MMSMDYDDIMAHETHEFTYNEWRIKFVWLGAGSYNVRVKPIEQFKSSTESLAQCKAIHDTCDAWAKSNFNTSMTLLDFIHSVKP